jgi:hypothetical protein
MKGLTSGKGKCVDNRNRIEDQECPEKGKLLFLAVILAGVGAYDVIALLKKGPEGTLTVKLRRLFKEYPELSFLLGVTVNHLLG